MKHNLRITIILLVMFLVTQLIGLWVVNHYTPSEKPLPYGFEPPEEIEPICKGMDNIRECLFTLFLSAFMFAIVILIFLFLVRVKSVWVMRIWFFIVVVLAIGLTLNALFDFIKIPNAYTYAIIIAIPLAIFKVFKRNIIIHNLTELLIYPGIAAVFVSLKFLINIWTIIPILLLISAYDIWAVWHSGIMQKMAKFQIDKVKIFSGFFVPYADKKTKQKIKRLKQKYKNKKISSKTLKKQKIKVNLAILGGGDVIFPIIAAGVFLVALKPIVLIPWKLWLSVFMVPLGATIALTYLFIFAKKRKFYPAMPFITAGIIAGMLLGWILSSIL